MELVQLGFDKIMQTRTHTVIVLKSTDKKFPIYVDPTVGRILQLYLTDQESERPLTHDFISSVFKGLEIQVRQVVISDLQDTTFYARLFLEQMRGGIKHVVEIDGRPSDFITLALMHNAPVWCNKKVLDEVVEMTD